MDPPIKYIRVYKGMRGGSQNKEVQFKIVMTHWFTYAKVILTLSLSCTTYILYNTFFLYIYIYRFSKRSIEAAGRKEALRF